MLKWMNDARLRAGVMLRERKERAEERRAAKRARQHHGHESRFWLLSIPATATLCAAFVEVYWAILFCIQATGRLDNDWAVAFGTGQQPSGAWHFAFDIRSVPVLIGLVAATVPIVMWSMVWLPVQMKARGTGMWRRVTMIVAGLLANALVIVSGTVVMNSNRQEQVRAGQVVEQQAGQSRAQLQSQIDGITADLNTMFNNRNAYMAQAASVGAARWQSTYIAQAQQTNDPRLPMIQRALGAAQAADDARARRDALRAQLAAAPTQAAVAAHVEDHAGVGLDTFATYAEVYRPPFVALICTIIGIFGTWWWVGLAEAMSRHNVSLSGWAPEDHRIEDLREEAPIAAEPMRPAREVVTDAETGEELIRIKPKPHWRKRKPTKVNVAPEAPPDETGAPAGVDGGDGGARSAALHGEHEPLAAKVESEHVTTDAPNAPLAMEASSPSIDHNTTGATEVESHSEISDEATAEALLAAAGEQVDEAVAVDATPAGGAAEGSLPAENEEAVQPALDAGGADQSAISLASAPVSEPAEQSASEQGGDINEDEAEETAAHGEFTERAQPETDRARLLSVAAE